MPVDSQHSQYTESLSKWKMVRDCVSGAKAVRGGGELYLPNPDETGSGSVARYKSYVERAQFVNVTARTRNAMVGMAFRKPTSVELPAQLDYLTDDATGDGLSLDQLGKNTIGNLLEVGRYGLLSDYPATDEELSDAQARSLNLQASIKTYPAESIINWQTTVIDGQVVLSLVVLKESYATGKGDIFAPESAEQYRVLVLVSGIYTVQIWREDELYSAAEPIGADGKNLKRIPFIIAGTYNNDPNVDDAALYDISEVNIGQYRNSADYEEGVFLHGQPMLHIDTGTMSGTQWKELNPNGVEVGARRGLVTNGGGSAVLMQTQANSAAFEAMSDKKEQMVSLGARLIEPGGQAETAEAARLKHAGDNSVLANIVQNSSEAIEKAVMWCGLFMGVSESVTIEINEDFYDKERTAQEVMADIQLYDRGLIAKQDIRGNLRKSGYIDMTRTDEEIEGDVGDIDPIE